MSLTGQIRTEGSSVTRWFDAHMDIRGSDQFINEWNNKLARRWRFCIDGTNPPIAGVAFDYLFRWYVQPLECRDLVAWEGARMIGKDDWIPALLEAGNTDPKLRPSCCVTLAYFEEIRRTGVRYTRIKSPLFFDFVDDKRNFGKVMLADVLTIRDIEELATSIPHVWDRKLKEHKAFSTPWIPNPDFAGSDDAGGADADWIMGYTLWDCKVSRKSKPLNFYHLRQLLGYVLLDYDDNYRIDTVGWYFARHTMLVEANLWDLIVQVFYQPNISDLRESFKDMLDEGLHEEDEYDDQPEQWGDR